MTEREPGVDLVRQWAEEHHLWIDRHLCRRCADTTGECRLGVRAAVGDDGVVRAEVVFDERHEGGTSVAHGGFIAAVYDELCGLALVADRIVGPTKTLEVEYHRPTPTFEVVDARAWVASRDGRRLRVEGDMHLRSNGERLTSARAVFGVADEAYLTRRAGWIATGEDPGGGR